jgi:hypothetical protein
MVRYTSIYALEFILDLVNEKMYLRLLVLCRTRIQAYSIASARSAITWYNTHRSDDEGEGCAEGLLVRSEGA